MGRKSKWNTATTTVKVAVNHKQYLLARLEALPKYIKEKQEELAPRATSARVKLAIEILAEIDQLIWTTDDEMKDK